MAWERSFEAKVLKIREKELKYQRLNYIIEVTEPVCGILCTLVDMLSQTLWNAIWCGTHVFE
jgi:hypothetical protein